MVTNRERVVRPKGGSFKVGSSVRAPFGSRWKDGVIIARRPDGRLIVQLPVRDADPIETSYDPAELTPAPKARRQPGEVSGELAGGEEGH